MRGSLAFDGGGEERPEEMRGNLAIRLCAVAVCLGGMITPTAAQPPAERGQRLLGHFDGTPGQETVVRGRVPVHGWALAERGVARVELFVDGAPVGEADLGYGRSDVAQRYPELPHSNRPGFVLFLDTTRFPNGTYTLRARVTAQDGRQLWLNERQLEFDNPPHKLVPFGRVEFPRREAELTGNCDLADPFRRYSVIMGHALAPGVGESDGGIAEVELLVDGVVFANNRHDCSDTEAMGGPSNCFGLPRPDLVAAFPWFQEAVLSGFRFVLDVGALVHLGYGAGERTLTVRATDRGDHQAVIDEVRVRFACDEAYENELAFGEVQWPRRGMRVKGDLLLVGWALDWEGVDEVVVEVDGVEVGRAIHGLVRPSVAWLYPGYPGSGRGGWSFDLDTTLLRDGERHVRVMVRDQLGDKTPIDELTVVVDNR